MGLPTAGSFLKALTQITGTASDPAPNASGISGIETRVRRDFDGQYWQSGGGWGPESTSWLSTVGPPLPWNKSSALPPDTDLDSTGLLTGRTYTLESRAFDLAGNTQTVLSSGAQFTFDKQAPVTKIKLPDNDLDSPGQKFFSSLPTISGTASDNFNVKKAEYRIERSAGGFWLGGSDFTGTADNSWRAAVGSTPASAPFVWTSTSVPNWTNQEFRIHTRSFDEAGNVLTYSTSTLTNGAVVTCILTSNMSGVTGSPATSNAITMVVDVTII